MAKQGEIDYFANIGVHNQWHAINKPFSDVHCHGLLAEMAAVFEMLPPPPGRLLDMGCGTGWTSFFFARRGYQVVGVDISSDMIAAGDRLREQAGLDNLQFVVSDYETLDFRSEFDMVVFFDSLHHAIDEELALERAFAALKPGGVLVTHEPGEGHAASEVARHAVESYGVTEKDMPPRKQIQIGHRVGFRQFHVLPFAVENRLQSYRLDAATPVPLPVDSQTAPPDPLANAGWAKRLFHAFIRRRLGFSVAGYRAFLTALPEMVSRAEMLAQHRGLGRGAFVAMRK
jgi:SAM-dependent methyltransferase